MSKAARPHHPPPPSSPRQRLFTPGPVQIPPEVALAGAAEMIHHRSEGFGELLRRVDGKLKRVLRTECDLLFFAASGSGAMEACVVNLFSPGNEVLVVEGGKFGQRWGELARTFGLRVHTLEIPWGGAPDPSELAEALEAHPQIRAVLTQLFETSTATVYDVRALSEAVQGVRAGVLFVVDAISGLIAEPLEADAWGVDVVVGASQKALMAPPGLSFVSVSPRAWEAVGRSRLPKYYWSFEAARRRLFFTPYTPAVSLLRQLDVSLDLLLEEGLDRVRARLMRYARATRAAAQALGLKVFSRRPGSACTALELPPGVPDGELRGYLAERFGLRIAGGQGPLKGKIVRIAHMGALSPADVLGLIAALEAGLLRLGCRIEAGAGVAAARAALELEEGE